MARIAWALLAALLLALPGPARAAGPNIAGNYKVTVLDQGDQPTLYILKFEVKDGKLDASVAATSEDAPEATVSEVSAIDDRLIFSLKVGASSYFHFEGRLPKEPGAPVRGSINVGRNLFPAQLESTKLDTLDPYEVNKELVARGGDDLRFFNATLSLINQAAEKKAKPEEVRAWAEKSVTTADRYGTRWQRDMATRIADALRQQDGFSELAVNYAKRAERLLGPKDTPGTRFRVMNVVAAALKKDGKTEEAKAYEAKLDQVDIGVKTEKFAGRKGNSDRAILIELFTGAQCPPCVGAGLALEGLTRTYKPSEVVVLSYHVHGNGPDPLTNQDSLDRSDTYGDLASGTPTVLINGRPLTRIGGTIDEAPDIYNGIRKLIDERLDAPAKATLKLTAVQKGTKIDIKAEVSDLMRVGEAVRLRLALVEAQVRYVGGNQIRHHAHVVRAMPLGAKGVALTEKTAKKEVTVDLADLRKSLTKYLDDFEKKEDIKFPGDRPMEFKNLKVIAFIQDDQPEVPEVLQAAQVDVKAE